MPPSEVRPPDQPGFAFYNGAPPMDNSNQMNGGGGPQQSYYNNNNSNNNAPPPNNGNGYVIGGGLDPNHMQGNMNNSPDASHYAGGSGGGAPGGAGGFSGPVEHGFDSPAAYAYEGSNGGPASNDAGSYNKFDTLGAPPMVGQYDTMNHNPMMNGNNNMNHHSNGNMMFMDPQGGNDGMPANSPPPLPAMDIPDNFGGFGEFNPYEMVDESGNTIRGEPNFNNVGGNPADWGFNN